MNSATKDNKETLNGAGISRWTAYSHSIEFAANGAIR